MSLGILEQLYAEQQKTNTLLAQLIASLGGAAASAEGEAEGKTAGKATGKTTTTRGKAAAKKAAPTCVHTKEEVLEAAVAVKNAYGLEKTKEILGGFGFTKTAEVTDDKLDEVFDALTAVLEEENDDEGDDV